jgi:hypothetical protein
MGIEINYQVRCEINTTPSGTATWADMGVMFKNIAKSLNENVIQGAYLADAGWGSSHVTGGQLTVSFTGTKMPGDACSDYLFSTGVQMAWGNARTTQIRITDSDNVILWGVTLANITDSGGDANGDSAVTLVVHSNGIPTISAVANGGSRLASLSIGALAISPQFTPGQFGYAVTTSGSTATITAVAEASTGATIAIKNGATTVTNGASATFTTGTNYVVVTVTNGSSVSTYSVIVTKTA